MLGGLFGRGDKNKTFKPLKPHARGDKQKALHQYAKATLGSGDVRSAVALPPGESEDEWIALHVTDCYNELSLLYGAVSEWCTRDACPVMSAGPRYEYRWGENIPKPISVSAPEYVDLLFQWVEQQLADESLFPTNPSKPFPKNFKVIARNIFKRLFRIYAHIYYSHFDQVIALKAEAHLNTCFKRFVLFLLQFDLIDRKELVPLEELIDNLTGGALAAAGGSGEDKK